MDNPKKDKAKHRFSPAEAADYLRQLADALERGHVALRSEELQLEGDVKLKQELKTKSGRATLKINLRIVAPVPVAAPGPASAQDEAPGALEGFVEITSPEEEPGESAGEMSYKRLKKAMGKSFASLKNSRKQGGGPSRAEAAVFLAQAREMCAFDNPGQGSENHSRFLAVLDRLEAALAAGESQALDEALDELGQCKSACHGKYK